MLSALFGWLNVRFMHMPQAVALLLMGLVVSLLLVGIEAILPGQDFARQLSNGLKTINFTQVVMNGMLAFLLFAAALDVNIRTLRSRAWHVAFLAVVGTTASTFLVGMAFWFASRWLSYEIPLPWAFVLGSLISPTDPVAVISALKNVDMPKEIDVEMQGEGLFNDGVAIVLFVVLIGFATQTKETTVVEVLVTFLREAGGGLALGVVTGVIAYFALRAIDEFTVEVLITLALVAGTYAVAQRLGASGPLSVVAAGLIVGSRGRRYAMSDESEKYVSAVWTLIDEILNAVLFMLIGLEVFVLSHEHYSIPLAVITIPIVLAARLVALSVPVLVFRSTRTLAIRNVPFLTWAGIRGGVSIALALALPNGGVKSEILAATYAVVLFSIIVQSSTLGQVARITVARGEPSEQPEERDPSEPKA